MSLVRQRLYALALGYEDLNDHQGLRRDVALQTAVGRTRALANASTLSRWENRSDRAQAWRLHEMLVEQFIGSFEHPPRKLVLDFDATDDRVHGRQEGRFFHGYYDHYCFLPLEAIRRLALKGTELARAYVGTIRLKLLKIGAVIICNTRRIRLLLASAYPYQDLFCLVAARLRPS